MSRREFESGFDPSKTADQSFQVPDLIGTVEGWRSWLVSSKLPPFGAAPKLFSYNHNYFWEPRQVNVATCTKPGCEVPGENCGCGFYSAKSLVHLMSMVYPEYDEESSGMFSVVGQVANWGKVIEGSQGWRSSKSYPVRLLVPYEALKLAIPLSEAYGVPVRPVNILAMRKGLR
jgi:hypothetical protein